ncbi:uncharacterized protein [Epargyreus clarus]|uniref:uncharacterized protein n=1 Tax=Epargyreus clarus TaxID=520877 RepID=UPI003C2B6208
MVGKWLVVLPLFVDLNKVNRLRLRLNQNAEEQAKQVLFLTSLKMVILQPITEESNVRRVRQLDLENCCPCPDDTGSARNGLDTSLSGVDCPCQPRASDAEASASILLPALKAIQPFVRQADQKSEPKPLLQPEVGLASSVLETLRQATDEEYQEALARDAARSAVQLIESDLSSIGDALTETPKNVVRIFLNPKDDMDDNLPEPSHIQETRCIHSPLESKHTIGQLKLRRPAPIIEVFNTPRKPNRKLKHKKLFHRNQYEMDSGVGASNVQERVISPNTDGNLQDLRLKSNPTLINLFAKNNADNCDDFQRDAAKDLDEKITTLKQKVQSRPNFKLRDLIDNLDANSDKEKPKFPVIDLKKYFATSTRLPPLSKRLEKPVFRTNKPLQLKDFLKLKDVELIPRKERTNNKPNEEKPLLSSFNLKSRSSSNYDANNNEKYNNCEDEDTNTAPSMNRDKMTIGSETIDLGKSETISKPDFTLDNDKSLDNSNNIMIQEPNLDECLDSVNDNMKSISSNPIDVGDQENNDECDAEISDDPNIALANDKANKENPKESVNNDGLEKEKTQILESNDDISNDESISNMYQVELLEDLNYPVEFDKSSMIPELDVEDTNKKTSNEIKTNQNAVNDPIAETSDNDLQVMEQSDEQLPMSQVFFKNTPVECISYDPSTDYSNPVVDVDEENLLADRDNVEDYLNTDLQEDRQVQSPNKKKHKKINTIKQKSSQVDNMKDDTKHVSFKDLQDMSNSLLNLSERRLSDKNSKTLEFNDENLKELNDDSFDNTELSIQNSSLEDSKEIETDDAGDDKISLNGKTGETSQDSDDNSCKTTIVGNKSNDLIEAENKKMANHLDTANSELSNEDSKPNLKMSSIPDITDILQGNKQSNILDNLKSKLENLFRTPEKASNSDVVASPEDNVNESSNMKPIIANFDDSDQLQRTPETLRKTLLPNIPGLSLGSYKNKLAVPKSLDRTINLDPASNSRISLLSTPSVRKDNQREFKAVQYKEPQMLRSPLENIDTLGSLLKSNTNNLWNSPLEIPRPFEDSWDPSSALTDLSDRLRSHTDNAIQNVKETLESRLRESQTVGFSRPSDTFDTNDILESISNRRDEFNEKLQAIHSDINDRFSTFQQSILDQFSQRPGINSQFEDDVSMPGLRSSHVPLKTPSPLSETSKLRTVPNTQNLKSLPKGVLDKSESTGRLKSSKIPKVSSVSRFQNSDEITPNLNKHLENLRSGIMFDKLSIPRTLQKLPVIPNSDRKVSLQKPVISFATTARPSLIPTPKTLKNAIHSVPKLNTDASNARQSKIPVLTDPKLTKNKFTLKPERINKLGEQLNSSNRQSLPTRVHQSQRIMNTGKEETISSEEDSTKSHINKLRKAILQRNPDLKAKSALKIPPNHWHIPKSERKGDDERIRTDILPKHKDDENRPSYIDTRHSATQNVEDLRLVEPLRENVPYKCKLMCYKDS